MGCLVDPGKNDWATVRRSFLGITYFSTNSGELTLANQKQWEKFFKSLRHKQVQIQDSFFKLVLLEMDSFGKVYSLDLRRNCGTFLLDWQVGF